MLTAKERALLVLRSMKDGENEDPTWRWNMPDAQVPAFNRLMALLEGVNRWIGIYVYELKGSLRELRLRYACLSSILLWQRAAFELSGFIMGCTKELITESDYREKEREARAEYRPLAELAYVLTEHYDGFANEDFDPKSGPEDRGVLPEAWDRVQAEKAKELAALVRSGELTGRGRGKALEVEAGGFYDWLGEPVPVLPAWAEAYEVVPDSEAEATAMHRYRREEAHKAYQEGPTELIVHLPDLPEEHKPKTPSQVNELVAASKETLKEGIVDVWHQVVAADRVIAEVADDFDGEDPATPDVREAIQDCREGLAELHKDVQSYTGPFELGEPSDEQLAVVQRLARLGL